MTKILRNSSIVSIGLLTPMLVFAQNLSGIHYLINQLHSIVQALVPLLIGVAVLVFCWGIVVYLFTGDKEKGKSVMISGVIALFVMTSVWGLVGILRTTLLGENAPNDVTVPTLNF